MACEGGKYKDSVDNDQCSPCQKFTTSLPGSQRCDPMLTFSKLLAEGQERSFLYERRILASDSNPWVIAPASNPSIVIIFAVHPNSVVFNKSEVWLNGSRNRVIATSENMTKTEASIRIFVEIDIDGLPAGSNHSLSVHLWSNYSSVYVVDDLPSLFIRPAQLLKPGLLSVDPMAIGLAGGDLVTAYVRISHQLNCGRKIPPTCANVAATAKLRIEFESLHGQVRNVTISYASGVLIVTFTSPPGRQAGVERANITMLGAESIPFALEYKMPRAEVTPIEGSISGGDNITVRATGWWPSGATSVPLPTNLAIKCFAFKRVFFEMTNSYNISLQFRGIPTILHQNPSEKQ